VVVGSSFAPPPFARLSSLALLGRLRGAHFPQAALLRAVILVQRSAICGARRAQIGPILSARGQVLRPHRRVPLLRRRDDGAPLGVRGVLAARKLIPNVLPSGRNRL